MAYIAIYVHIHDQSHIICIYIYIHISYICPYMAIHIYIYIIWPHKNIAFNKSMCGVSVVSMSVLRQCYVSLKRIRFYMSCLFSTTYCLYLHIICCISYLFGINYFWKVQFFALQESSFENMFPMYWSWVGPNWPGSGQLGLVRSGWAQLLY